MHKHGTHLSRQSNVTMTGWTNSISLYDVWSVILLSSKMILKKTPQCLVHHESQTLLRTEQEP